MIQLEDDSPTRRKIAAEKKPANQPTSSEASYHRLKVFQRFGLQKIISEVFFPIFLMLSVPISTMSLWYICRYEHGNLTEFLSSELSWTDLMYEVLFNQWHGSLFPIYVIGGFLTWAIVLTLALPGESYNGPITDKGNTPVYTDNGMKFFGITLVSFFSIAILLELYGFSVTVICDRYGEFLSVINVGALLFCLFLYVKGMWFPSSSDNGSSGNPVFDYYWGVELYPRIGGIDLKQLTNCRWGMMVWSLTVILFWLKSLKTYGFVDSHFVTMLLIELYLAKFFYWESGYMKTIDIVVDRAGFYICYGCLAFVPVFYTLPSIYLAYHPVYIGTPLANFILVVGLISLYLNYDADAQRVMVRKTNGKCLIWNKEPVIINAKYVLLDGTQSENILLASGYWGISRHFHYLPELALAFCWCTTAMFSGIVPYLYVIFLLVLLVHRSMRDDDKCFNKYGKYWLQYRAKVPYKIVPGVF